MKTTKNIFLVAISIIIMMGLQSCGTAYNGTQQNTSGEQWFSYKGGKDNALEIVKYFQKRLYEAGSGESNDDKIYDPLAKTGTLIIEGKHYTLQELSPGNVLITFNAPNGCSGSNAGRIKINISDAYCNSCYEISYFPEDLAVTHRMIELKQQLQTWNERMGFGALQNNQSPMPNESTRQTFDIKRTGE